MNVGYDIRNGHLYISDFFNASAKLELVLSAPVIVNEPSHVGLVGQEYNWTAIALTGQQWHQACGISTRGLNGFLHMGESNADLLHHLRHHRCARGTIPSA